MKKIFGFTLLEVMVALAIFAVAAIALLRVQGEQVSISQHLIQKSLAHWVAMNHIADMQLANAFPEVGYLEATQTMAGKTWLISINVKASPSDSVRLVDLSVSEKSTEFGKKNEAISILTGALYKKNVVPNS